MEQRLEKTSLGLAKWCCPHCNQYLTYRTYQRHKKVHYNTSKKKWTITEKPPTTGMLPSAQCFLRCNFMSSFLCVDTTKDSESDEGVPDLPIDGSDATPTAEDSGEIQMELESSSSEGILSNINPCFMSDHF